MTETREELTDREVREFFAFHDSCWASLDFERLAQIWDEHDQHPTYIGDEYWGPVEGWGALRRHLGRMESRIDHAALRSTVRRARELAPDVVMALVLLDWSFRGVESSELHTGSAWVTALLRRRDGALRMFHYMEASVYLTDEARETLNG
jgi:hypothetical protein